MPPYIYNYNKPGAKTVAARVDTASHGVTTPAWGLYSEHHPGKIRSHSRTRNPTIHRQFQQTGDEHGGSQGRYRPARCRTPNRGFIDPVPPSGRIRSHPLIRNPSIHLYNYNKRGAKTVVLRVSNAPHGVETPIRVPPHFINPSIHLRIHQTGDKTGGPPCRYRPARCANPELGLVKPAPPW